MVVEISTITGTTLATEIKDRFGDVGAVQINDTMILRWINQGVLDIISQTPYLKQTAQTNLLAGQSVYSMSAAFPAARVVRYDAVTAGGKKLKFLPFAQFQEIIPDAGESDSPLPADPAYFTEYAGTITLWPEPRESVSNGLVIYFSAYPEQMTDLANQLPVPDRFFNSLRDYVMAQALELDENFEASQLKMAQMRNGLTEQFGREDESPTDYYPTITDTTAQDYGARQYHDGWA